MRQTFRRQKQNKDETLIRKGLVCLLALVMVVSGYKSLSTFLELHSEDKANDELIKILEEAASVELVELEAKPSAEPVDPIATEAAVEAPEPYMPARNVGYAKLKEMNSDFYGWLAIDGTKINYPVMSNPKDGQYYLRKAFDKQYSLSGSLFTDYRCTAGGGNLIIYGHHMKNGTMFGSLPNYAKQYFYDAHKTIQFDTLQANGTYEVMAAFYGKVYKSGEDGLRYYNYYDLSDPAVFDEYVKAAMEISVIKTGVEASYGDQLLTLSTCSYHTDDGRFVVIAKKVK